MDSSGINFRRVLLGAGLLVLALQGCNFAPSATPAVEQPTLPSSLPTSLTSANVGCDNVYFPVVEGASKTFFGSTSLGSTYSEVNTITDVGSTSFLVRVDLHDAVHWVETWECTAQGLAQLMAKDGLWSATMMGDEYGIATIETLSQTGVTYPISINPGDNWSQETTYHIISTRESGDGSLSYRLHAAGLEAVTVPAGTYQAMRIDVDVAALGPTVTVYYNGSMWMAPGFGRVKQTGETSIGEDDPDPSTATVELESYSNP